MDIREFTLILFCLSLFRLRLSSMTRCIE